MGITCIHFKLKATVLAMLYQFKAEILLIFTTFDAILNLPCKLPWQQEIKKQGSRYW